MAGSVGLGLGRALAGAARCAWRSSRNPAPPQARANIVCDVGSAPGGCRHGGVDAVTGGVIGGGNPVGDACNAVSGEVTGRRHRPDQRRAEGRRQRDLRAGDDLGQPTARAG